MHFNPAEGEAQGTGDTGDPKLQTIFNRLTHSLQRDTVVQQITDRLRQTLQVDRVVLYYFYRQWEGRVTFESLSAPEFSIYGSTGPNQCFNDEYAALYLAGRVRAIDNIETEDISACHREFLQGLQVKANLVAPVLTAKGLWGLFVAHHCQQSRHWLPADITLIQAGAEELALSPTIRSSESGEI